MGPDKKNVALWVAQGLIETVCRETGISPHESQIAMLPNEEFSTVRWTEPRAQFPVSVEVGARPPNLLRGYYSGKEGDDEIVYLNFGGISLEYLDGLWSLFDLSLEGVEIDAVVKRLLPGFGGPETALRDILHDCAGQRLSAKDVNEQLEFYIATRHEVRTAEAASG